MSKAHTKKDIKIYELFIKKDNKAIIDFLMKTLSIKIASGKLLIELGIITKNNTVFDYIFEKQNETFEFEKIRDKLFKLCIINHYEHAFDKFLSIRFFLRYAHAKKYFIFSVKCKNLNSMEKLYDRQDLDFLADGLKIAICYGDWPRRLLTDNEIKILKFLKDKIVGIVDDALTLTLPDLSQFKPWWPPI